MKEEGRKVRKKEEGKKAIKTVGDIESRFVCRTAKDTRTRYPTGNCFLFMACSRPRNLIDKYRADTTSSDYVRALDS